MSRACRIQKNSDILGGQSPIGQPDILVLAKSQTLACCQRAATDPDGLLTTITNDNDIFGLISAEC